MYIFGWGTNHFTERWWDKKIFSIFKMGYEVFFDDMKLSSALIPRIKNDHSLKKWTNLDSFLV